jgi:hypothetical protein
MMLGLVFAAELEGLFANDAAASSPQQTENTASMIDSENKPR